MSQQTETVLSEFEVEVVVRSVQPLADDVVELQLARSDGRPLPPWTPGAHIDLILRDDLVRQYSLCGDPGQPGTYTIAVLKTPDSRGGSLAVHALTEGDKLRIRGPRNHFGLATSASYVFIAGGIGITPILPMIQEAVASGADWSLHYGGRSRGSMAYLDRISSYGDRVTIVPQDEAGMLDLGAILGTPRPGTLVYCCGPEGLLGAVENRCADWPKGALHVERFTAKAVDTVGADAAFELVLQRSGITLIVPPDKPVVQVMREAGVPVLVSCQQGICGTCETPVLAGEVDHRDSVLDDDEKAANDCMMVCVSRCKSAQLVLDA